MTNLTPVEALQREAEHVRGFVELDRDVFVNPKMMRVFLAALELAKADAELQAHDYAGSITVPVLDALEKNRLHDEWLAEKFRIEQLVQEARAKLYEALQQ